MLIHAYTGLPKVIALSISILHRIKSESSHCQAILLVPDWDETNLFQKVLRDLGKDMVLTVDLLVGNSRDRRLVKFGVQVIVGTPGPILDFIRNHALKMDAVRILIIDQLDRILL